MKRFILLLLFVAAAHGANEPIRVDTKSHQVLPPTVSPVAPADFDFTGRTVIGLPGGGGGGGGTVTSVGLAAPPETFIVTGSPVTTNGTLTLGWKPVAAGLVLSGPPGAAIETPPTFRSLVLTDIPDLSTLYQPLDP